MAVFGWLWWNKWWALEYGWLGPLFSCGTLSDPYRDTRELKQQHQNDHERHYDEIGQCWCVRILQEMITKKFSNKNHTHPHTHRKGLRSNRMAVLYKASPTKPIATCSKRSKAKRFRTLPHLSTYGQVLTTKSNSHQAFRHSSSAMALFGGFVLRIHAWTGN